MSEPTDPRFTPEALALTRRAELCSISQTDFAQWQHHPVTAGFLQYMEDQIEFMRGAAADMLEDGMFVVGHQHQDRNPDTLRGQIIMLRQLRNLTIDQIKSFYAPPEADVDETAKPEGTAYGE